MKCHISYNSAHNSSHVTDIVGSCHIIMFLRVIIIIIGINMAWEIRVKLITQITFLMHDCSGQCHVPPVPMYIIAIAMQCVHMHTLIGSFDHCLADTGRKRTLFHSKWVNSISYNLSLECSFEITPDFLCLFKLIMHSKFQSHSYWQSFV